MAHISRCKHGLGLAECDECFPKDRLLEGWKEGYERMNKQHKWHKEIKAWADGAEIEYIDNDSGDDWQFTSYPNWQAVYAKFRIKPQPKEPQYLQVDIIGGELTISAEHLFDKNITGKFKIKLEQDNE